MKDHRQRCSLGPLVSLLSVGAAFAVAPVLVATDQAAAPLLLIGVLLGTWVGGGWGGGTAVAASTGGLVLAGWMRRGLVAVDGPSLIGPGLFATVATLAVFGLQSLRRRGARMQEERRQLRGTLHSIADALLVTDAEARIKHMNRIAEDLTGWPAWAARGAPVDRVLCFANPHTWIPMRGASALLRSKSRSPQVFRALGLLGHDGVHHVVEGSASRIQAADGTPTGVVVVFRDVTQRRRSEAVLHASEERHRILTNLSFDFATTSRVGSNGRILLESATDRFEAVTGYTPRAFRDRGGWASILHPHDVPVAAAGLRRLLAGRSDTRDMRIRTRRGELRWLRFLAHPVRDHAGGRVHKLYAAVKDITEHKEAEFARNEEIRQASFARDVGLALTRSDDTSEMLANCATAMVRHLGGALARIWVFDSDRNALLRAAAAGLSPDHDPCSDHIDVGAGHIGKLALDGRPVLSNDLLTDSDERTAAWARHEALVSFAGYPMVVDDQLIGVMAVYAKQPLTPVCLDAMAAVAGGIAVGVQRKRIEARRREEREWLEVTLASLADAVVATDTEGNVVSMNRAAAALFGHSERDLAGVPLDDVLQIREERTGEELESPVRRVLREGRTVVHRGTATLRVRGGRMRGIDLQAAPIRNADGALLGVVLVAQDVTEHRAGARALRSSEARKAAILDTALDGIVTIDNCGRIVEFNRAAERVFGYRGEDLIGLPLVSRLIPERFRAFQPDGFARLLAVGDGPMLGRRVELQALRADGTEFPIELAVAPITTGEAPLFTVHVRDITERHALERRRSARLAITEAVAVAARVTDALPLVLQATCEAVDWDVGVAWLVDAEANVLRRACEWSSAGVKSGDPGHDAREATVPQGHGLAGRAWVHARHVWVPDVREEAARARGSLATRCELRTGAAFPVLLGTRVLGVLEFGGRAVRQPDPDVVELMASLGGQIGQSIGRHDVEQQLRDADRRKDRFLAVLAHELRAPLAPIRSAIELIRIQSSRQDPTEAPRQVVERQLKNLVRLVDDLLDLSRISSGRMELRPQTVRLADIVASAVETSAHHLKARQLELTLSLPPPDLLVRADPARLSQVLSNLLHNAARHTPAHGHVGLRAQHEHEALRLEVWDDGAGIPGDMLERVFDMFTQVRDPRASQEGLGIGLTLVRQIVELHGGTVKARSGGPGRGTSFRIRLPIVVQRGVEVEESAAAPAAVGGGSRRRVLVVDDNVDAAESLGALLRHEGHDVAVAYDSASALAAADAALPHIVFLDLGLPGMDGCAVARRLRRLPSADDVTLVALTGWGQAADRRRARDAGFDVHLTKPSDPEVVRRLVQTHPRLAGPRAGLVHEPGRSGEA